MRLPDNDIISLRTIWEDSATNDILTIDQTKLPFETSVSRINSLESAVSAIRDMIVRGAPLIGVTAAYGMYFAARSSEGDFLEDMRTAAKMLIESRPTAVNLKAAVDAQTKAVRNTSSRSEAAVITLSTARKIADAEIDMSRKIGSFGADLIERISEKKSGKPVNILTHCNAGRLATVILGTALAPVYTAALRGIDVHVWADETRPRLQGAALTAYELTEAGIPNTVIADNAGGILMQRGLVDMVITGSDRTTRRGDVCNKIGTYLKALAAHDNGIPFYAAMPSSTIDFDLWDGVAEIPVEERSEDEVLFARGYSGGQILDIRTAAPGSRAYNPGFDVTPARLVTGIITERGVCSASEESLREMFPESIKS